MALADALGCTFNEIIGKDNNPLGDYCESVDYSELYLRIEKAVEVNEGISLSADDIRCLFDNILQKPSG